MDWAERLGAGASHSANARPSDGTSAREVLPEAEFNDENRDVISYPYANPGLGALFGESYDGLVAKSPV